MKRFICIFLCIAFALVGCKSTKDVTVTKPVMPKYERTQEVVVNTVDSIKISGTLEFTSQERLAIIIAGSGPTDRDCNSGMGMKSDAFKMLAQELSSAGISSYRYDKRGIANSTKVAEVQMTLHDRAIDISAIVDHFAQDFNQIILVGHSEGVLVGSMAAANNSKVNKFVGVAGTSVTMDKIIMEQMAKYPKALPMVEKHFDELKRGEPFSEVSPILQSLFRESIRPFLLSALELDPIKEISKLSIPALIVGGSCDVQVPTDHAKNLAKAVPNSSLLIVDNMGHVLKELEADCSNQMAEYKEAGLPLNKKLAEGLIAFIKS